MKFPAGAAVLWSVVALSACSATTNAIVDTLKHVAPGGGSVAGARLDPNFRFLRITIKGRVAFVALGGVESHAQGPIEVWYSAEREVLRFQNGRLVGAIGLTTEWRNVSLPELPSWSVLARSKEPVHWSRVRDVMPGYRFGLKDALVLRVISAPARSLLSGADPQRLTWFEESVETGTVEGLSSGAAGALSPDLALPAARYAVDFRDSGEIVVYGEQCLTRDLCFAWQRWSAEQQNSAGR